MKRMKRGNRKELKSEWKKDEEKSRSQYAKNIFKIGYAKKRSVVT